LGDRALNIAHARFRLNFTSLSHDLHLRTILPSPTCRCDNTSHDTYAHVFLSCRLYANKRNKLFLDTTPLFRSSGLINNDENIQDIDSDHQGMNHPPPPSGGNSAFP
jgi:hypothetical protein